MISSSLSFVFLFSFFVSICTSYVITKLLIPRLKSKGIAAVDANKPDKRKIPEMGGLAVLISFNIGIYMIILLIELWDLISLESNYLLASLLTIFGVSIIGIIDDLIDVSQRTKAILPFIFSMHLGLYIPTEMYIPILGNFDFGLLMLLLIPLSITCAVNSSNMLEGFNGLGTSLGIITCFFLIYLSLVDNQITGLLILVPLLGSLIGFLYFNWFPARIFPGDTLTLFLGAALACSAIINNLKLEFLILAIPYIAEFFLKAKDGFKAECFAKELNNNILVYDGKVESLTHYVMKNFKTTEPGLVKLFCILQILLGFVAVSVNKFL